MTTKVVSILQYNEIQTFITDCCSVYLVSIPLLIDVYTAYYWGSYQILVINLLLKINKNASIIITNLIKQEDNSSQSL